MGITKSIYDKNSEGPKRPTFTKLAKKDDSGTATIRAGFAGGNIFNATEDKKDSTSDNQWRATSSGISNSNSSSGNNWSKGSTT